jgi:hypothetical protein
MNWVLIIMVWSTLGSNASPALTTAQYRTEAMCQAAGVKAVQDLSTKYHAVKFSCSRKE